MKADTAIALPLGLLRSERELDAARVDATDEELERELARNEATLAIVRRLGVGELEALPLAFVFETGGAEADAGLAAFLERELGYEVWIEQGGVSGRTTPVQLSFAALEVWVRGMLGAGRRFGGCPFGGWTVALSRG
jgi:hypothetical protein